MKKMKTAALAALAGLMGLAALSFAAPDAGAQVPQEAAIRKALSERYPDAPKIDEVAKTPVSGLYEVRIGKQLFYTDAQGAYLIDGEIVDTRTQRNLTQERLAKLNAIDFASLPLEDAVVWKTGNGKRKIAVFSDPNCGYCKRFERELSEAKDLTVYTFLMPILGGDSPDKAKAIWCANDATAAYRGWMLDGTAPPRPLGECKTPIERNVALGRKHQITGTPAIVFEDGTRVPGMLKAAQLEEQLAKSSGGSAARR